ncbi:putative Cysteine/Histidine-rich C1 domain family protein [Hibiscus syriacus]|uniref:Cysteine/Histidine-rich C1 domain family protein n=1 Tax=Hibiscus syriacus TaxID=106335 RepID=A0A6A2ZNP7_HIBSY|nr:putative Cysteine/Histidine-rich C1 domain family protein [Hibiscus syriacus]
MATLSNETVQHFTLCCHPLTEVSADTEFLCGGCRTLGSGTRFRCEPCGLDLHHHCADCPTEISSFMHQHSLQLVGCKTDRVCDLCDDPVEGLFYRCELCDFNVHPICTQLPQYTRHAMHNKDHLLWLEISVPIGCMVCKEMCSSWRYRCKDCSFHLHLDCILAPCEEERTRSLGTIAPPPPSAWPPAYNCGYGYGGIPPPPQNIVHPPFPPHVHGYGGIPLPPQHFAHPSFPPHVHGYGGIPPPPQYFSHPSSTPHVHGYWGIAPPPQYFAQTSFPPHDHGNGSIAPPPQHFAQTSFPPQGHGYGAPYSNHAQSSGDQVGGHGGKVLKRIYAIVQSLALGVSCNLIAGILVS